MNLMIFPGDEEHPPYLLSFPAISSPSSRKDVYLCLDSI